MYRNSLIAKTILEDFVVLCCCIFETEYAEFISLIFKSSCLVNSATFEQ